MFHIEKKLWRLVEPLLIYLVSSELGPDPVTCGGLLDQRDLHGLIRVIKGWQLESVGIKILKSVNVWRFYFHNILEVWQRSADEVCLRHIFTELVSCPSEIQTNKYKG